jgi:hypothetical protein
MTTVDDGHPVEPSVKTPRVEYIADPALARRVAEMKRRWPQIGAAEHSLNAR